MTPREICFARRRNPFYPLRIAALVWLFLALIFFTGLFVARCAQAKKPYPGVVEATVLRVIDGDTLAVEIQGWPGIVGEDIGVRVYGIDTRESHDGGGAAKEAMQALVRPGDKVLLMHMRRGKFFRIVARVKFGDRYEYDWEEYTLERGLAYPYFGGKKRPIGWKPKDYAPSSNPYKEPVVDEPSPPPADVDEGALLNVPHHRTSECKEYELPSGVTWNECEQHNNILLPHSGDLVWDPSKYGVEFMITPGDDADKDIAKLQEFLEGLELRHNLLH